LTALGYPVRVVSGSGDQFHDHVETRIHPLFGSSHPDILKVKAQLDAGTVMPEFDSLTEQVTAALREALAGCAVCIAHNVPSLNKNLHLTAALAKLSAEKAIRVLAWCHDLAWTNPQYQPELHEGYPWDLLRQVWPNTRYVTVSEPRRLELAELLDLSPEAITVMVPGVDPARFYRWTPTTKQVVERFNLLDADGLLLVPARLTRRKNITLALQVLAELRLQSARDFRIIVTGPPGPHNPNNPGYLQELLDLRRYLNLENSAHFLYSDGGTDETPLVPDDDTVADLYHLSDSLLFPTLQEGFGIPILEAGMALLPVFCADIPPLRATGQGDVVYFDPVNTTPEHIAANILTTLDSYAPYRLRVRVRKSYRWHTIIRDRLLPLLEE
jgi:glycosyltransferase involved in cell wall biosynthesis